MNNKYDYIINPKTKRKVKVKSKLGKSLIESYKKELIGGADCQISDYLVYDEQIKKTHDLKRYIADQQRYFNSLYILVNKRNIERLLLISEVEHLFNGLREEIEIEIKEFDDALKICERKTVFDTIRNKFIAIKFNRKASFLLAKNKFLKKVQTFLQDKEASARGRLPEYLVSSGLVSDRGDLLSKPTEAVIKRNNRKIKELMEKKDDLLISKKIECKNNLIKNYYFPLEEKGNLLKFLWKFYREINIDIGKQLENDKTKIERELCIPTTKIYRVPSELLVDIQKIYPHTHNIILSGQDGTSEYRLYSAKEEKKQLANVGIDHTRIPEHGIFNWNNIKIKIAEDFFGNKFEPLRSDQCIKKCSCLIDGKSESSCFGKVWSDETKNKITAEYDIIFQTSELYKVEIDTLMKKLNN